MDVTTRSETFPLPLEAPARAEDVPTPVAGGPRRRIRDSTARTDPLTGAPARATLAPGFAAVRGRAASIGLLLIDIDHFKSINDAFGHAAGDAVLRNMARVPKWCCAEGTSSSAMAATSLSSSCRMQRRPRHMR